LLEEILQGGGRRRPSPSVFVASLLALCAAALLLRESADRVRPPSPATTFDVPPFPADVARPLSFGFATLVADLSFLEAIQVHGGRRAKEPEPQQRAADRALARLLHYAVEMDRKYRLAYRFAGMALIRQTFDGKAYNVLAAEQILQQGVRERPDDWQIPFNLGFIQSFYLGHMAEASANLALAARLPSAPRYLGFLSTRLAADAGELSAARAMAEEMVGRASEESTREEWAGRLRDIEMEERARKIERAVKQYREATGRDARSLDELISAHILPAIPDEPHGGRFQLKDGEVISTAADRLRIRGRKDTQANLEVH
jgi:hypothetical protein